MLLGLASCPSPFTPILWVSQVVQAEEAMLRSHVIPVILLLRAHRTPEPPEISTRCNNSLTRSTYLFLCSVDWRYLTRSLLFCIPENISRLYQAAIRPVAAVVFAKVINRDAVFRSEYLVQQVPNTMNILIAYLDKYATRVSEQVLLQ